MTPRLERPSTTRQRRRNRERATPNADGSPLEGFVEFPLDGGVVERLTVMTGWHAWGGQPVAAVAIEVDGRVVGGARMGDLRGDVAVAQGDVGYAQVGWAADVDLRAAREPTVTLRVIVFPGVDHPGVRLDPITVHVKDAPTLHADGEPIPRVLGRIDVPAEGVTVERGPLVVRGWARCTTSSISHVRLTANGVELGRARLGIDRGDVAAADQAADAPICGFEQVVDLGVLRASTTDATIVATAVALDGTTANLGVELVIAAPAPASRRAHQPALVHPTTRSARGAFDLLVVTHDLGLGGAQLWLLEALDRMGAGRDFPCSLIAFGTGPLAVELERLGIDVHVSSPVPVHHAAAYEGRLAELGAWMLTAHHSVALVNTFRAFAGADLAERHGLPVVWAVHESLPEPLVWAFDHPGVVVDPSVRSAASGALARAGAVIFESAATQALYEDRAPGRTAVVPYGIDTGALDRFAAATTRGDARRALGLDAAGRVLLVVGTLEPRKAQTLLVEAFAAVATRHPDATMALVGDFATSYSAALREFARRAGLAGRVRIEPVTPDVAMWYRAADALVCGSDVESLPRSVLDAMCLGLPVVATAVFGIGELLTDGETGLLFEANDLASAISAIDRVLTADPDRLAELAARGSALVHQRHDAAGYPADVLALLRGLHDQPEASPADALAHAAVRVGASAQSASE